MAAQLKDLKFGDTVVPKANSTYTFDGHINFVAQNASGWLGLDGSSDSLLTLNGFALVDCNVPVGSIDFSSGKISSDEIDWGSAESGQSAKVPLGAIDIGDGSIPYSAIDFANASISTSNIDWGSAESGQSAKVPVDAIDLTNGSIPVSAIYFSGACVPAGAIDFSGGSFPDNSIPVSSLENVTVDSNGFLKYTA